MYIIYAVCPYTNSVNYCDELSSTMSYYFMIKWLNDLIKRLNRKVIFKVDVDSIDYRWIFKPFSYGTCCVLSTSE